MSLFFHAKTNKNISPRGRPLSGKPFSQEKSLQDCAGFFSIGDCMKIEMICWRLSTGFVWQPSKKSHLKRSESKQIREKYE